MKLNQRGMTIAELSVTLVVTTVMIGAIMAFALNYQRYGFSLEADLDTFSSRLDAGDYIRETVGTSTGLITQNSLPDPQTNNPDPADASNLYWKVIHAVPGNINAGASTTPVLYFRRYAFNNSNQYIMNGINPYENEYVMYLNGNTKQLLVRTIANSSAPGNALRSSCPPPGTATCPPDKIIANDIASIDARYFSRTGNVIDHNAIIDSSTGQAIGPDFQVVDVLELKLNLTKKTLYQTSNTINNNTTIRIALRNT